MTADCLVVGGGPAGSSLGIHLARAGRSVVLVEREHHAVDKVCGEFVSGEAHGFLSALGLDLEALGARRLEHLRLAFEDNVSECPLPFSAWSLSRRVLDESLLSLASAAGVEVRRGARAESLSDAGGTWSARLHDGTNITARSSFLATGKHDLRGFKRPRSLQNDLIAFKTYLKLTERQSEELERSVELSFFRGGYAGLQLIEDGRANLSLLVQKSRFAELGHRFDTFLAALRSEVAHLERRLEGARACQPRPLAVAAIPYGYVRRGSAGPFCVGDQAAVVPSFCGEGIVLSLVGSELAAQSHLRGLDAEAFQRTFGSEVSTRLRGATWLSLGLVWPPSQRLLMTLATRLPSLAARVASQTRFAPPLEDGAR